MTDKTDLLARTNIDVWYCESINMIRVVADPGGDALTIEQARELRAHLGRVIGHAKRRELQEARP